MGSPRAGIYSTGGTVLLQFLQHYTKVPVWQIGAVKITCTQLWLFLLGIIGCRTLLNQKRMDEPELKLGSDKDDILYSSFSSNSMVLDKDTCTSEEINRICPSWTLVYWKRKNSLGITRICGFRSCFGQKTPVMYKLCKKSFFIYQLNAYLMGTVS